MVEAAVAAVPRQGRSRAHNQARVEIVRAQTPAVITRARYSPVSRLSFPSPPLTVVEEQAAPIQELRQVLVMRAEGVVPVLTALAGRSTMEGVMDHPHRIRRTRSTETEEVVAVVVMTTIQVLLMVTGETEAVVSRTSISSTSLCDFSLAIDGDKHRLLYAATRRDYEALS